MKAEILRLDPKKDSRGWLLKVLMRGQLGADHRFGEIYVVSAEPGQLRASHYHEKTSEWFCLIEGCAELNLHDIDSGEQSTVSMDGGAPVCVSIPPRMAHAIRAAGNKPAVLLAYADRPYDPEDPDTFPHQFG